jgi:hypothetical protein
MGILPKRMAGSYGSKEGHFSMRQKFVSDDDGHWYLINAEDEAEFDRWVEQEESDSAEPWKGRDFNADRIPGDPSRWTFERAQIDQ